MIWSGGERVCLNVLSRYYACMYVYGFYKRFEVIVSEQFSMIIHVPPPSPLPLPPLLSSLQRASIRLSRQFLEGKTIYMHVHVYMYMYSVMYMYIECMYCMYMYMYTECMYCMYMYMYTECMYCMYMYVLHVHVCAACTCTLHVQTVSLLHASTMYTYIVHAHVCIIFVHVHIILIASGIGLQIYQELNIISQLLVVHRIHVLLLKV